MKSLIAGLLFAVVVAALPVAPAHAQVPALSLKRVSLGLTAEYVSYRPASAFAGLNGQGEIKVALPLAYNLGRFSSLQGKVRYGVSSRVYEYSGGITLHILARGEAP